jgi:multidrug efflux pump
MLGVTLFGIFLTPIFYFAIQWVGDASRTSDCKPEDPKDANNSPLASMDLRDSKTIASQETKAFKALVPGGDSHG